MLAASRREKFELGTSEWSEEINLSYNLLNNYVFIDGLEFADCRECTRKPSPSTHNRTLQFHYYCPWYALKGSAEIGQRLGVMDA